MEISDLTTETQKSFSELTLANLFHLFSNFLDSCVFVRRFSLMICFLSDPSRGQECRDLKEASFPWPSPAHSSPARPGFSVGHIAVSLVRQPGALGRWQGVRASGRGPLKSHLRGATPTRPLRCRLFWASPEAARLPFLEQQHSRPHTVASGKWGEGKVSSLFSVKAPRALGEVLQLLSSRKSLSRGTVYLSFTLKKF